MTKQEAYDGIVAWFTRPDAELGYSDEQDACVYRGDNDPASTLRCAVGCLIPDEKYDPEMEGHTIDHSPLLEVLGVSLDEYHLAGFLRRAQELHDSTASGFGSGAKGVERFLAKLHDLARENGLTVAA